MSNFYITANLGHTDVSCDHVILARLRVDLSEDDPDTYNSEKKKAQPSIE